MTETDKLERDLSNLKFAYDRLLEKYIKILNFLMNLGKSIEAELER